MLDNISKEMVDGHLMGIKPITKFYFTILSFQMLVELLHFVRAEKMII